MPGAVHQWPMQDQDVAVHWIDTHLVWPVKSALICALRLVEAAVAMPMWLLLLPHLLDALLAIVDSGHLC